MKGEKNFEKQPHGNPADRGDQTNPQKPQLRLRNNSKQSLKRLHVKNLLNLPIHGQTLPTQQTVYRLQIKRKHNLNQNRKKTNPTFSRQKTPFKNSTKLQNNPFFKKTVRSNLPTKTGPTIHKAPTNHST